MSVLGNAKSNCHRKTYPVEPGGTGREYMFLLGETWRVRVCQESAEAVVALTPGESRDERRAEESREDHSPARIGRARRQPTRSRRCNCGSYRGGGPSPSGWIPAPGEARGGRVLRVPNPGARRGPMGVRHLGRSRAKPAGLNRRMRKTACPVVWEGWRAQSRQPDPIDPLLQWRWPDVYAPSIAFAGGALMVSPFRSI